MNLKQVYIWRRYEDLTPWEIQMFISLWIFNGFWGAGQHPVIKFFIWLILKRFNIAIANKHDYWFWLWYPDRATCDWKFYKAMNKDTLNTWILIPYYLLISLLAYVAIRLLWKKYYDTKGNYYIRLAISWK